MASRPEWLPPSCEWRNLELWLCYYCADVALHLVRVPRHHKTFALCDSPECEQAAREAICGEKMAERVEATE